MARMRLCMVPALVAAALAGAAPTPLAAEEAPKFTQTLVLDDKGLERLLNPEGLTLQWISWDRRGPLESTVGDEYLHLSGYQQAADGAGRLELEGDVLEIGANYFVFQGTIRITGSPDAERSCEKNKLWHFAVTQNRKYYRLREFEWCDDLTDYVDIYF